MILRARTWAPSGLFTPSEPVASGRTDLSLCKALDRPARSSDKRLLLKGLNTETNVATSWPPDRLPFYQ